MIQFGSKNGPASGASGLISAAHITAHLTAESSNSSVQASVHKPSKSPPSPSGTSVIDCLRAAGLSSKSSNSIRSTGSGSKNEDRNGTHSGTHSGKHSVTHSSVNSPRHSPTPRTPRSRRSVNSVERNHSSSQKNSNSPKMFSCLLHTWSNYFWSDR